MGFIDGLDGTGSTGTFAVIGLAKFEQGFLDRLASGDTPEFNTLAVGAVPRFATPTVRSR